MKTTKINSAVFVTLLLLPAFLKAQWHTVRFDSTNTFTKVFSVTPNTTFVIGREPIKSEPFILRTNNGGTIWDSIPLNTPGNFYAISELFFIDKDNGFIGGNNNDTNQVLFKTVNNGNTWIDISPNPTSSSYPPIGSINFIDPQNGFVSDGTNLYTTTNGGTTWTSTLLPFEINDLFFTDINNGYACGHLSSSSSYPSGIVMKTSDGGQNWNPLLSVNEPNLFVSSFGKLDFVNSNIGFTELSHKLYRTQNGGN